MKKILILLITICGLSSYAQTIISLEEAMEFRKNNIAYPESVTYIKDVNGTLNKYLGRWKGSFGSKNYEFFITKYEEEIEFDSFKIDELLVRCLITDTNGTIIEDNRTISLDNVSIISLGLDNNPGVYRLFYAGKDSTCGNKANIYISINIQDANKMNFYTIPSHILMSDEECPNGYIAPIFPKDNLSLVKQ